MASSLSSLVRVRVRDGVGYGVRDGVMGYRVDGKLFKPLA